MTTVQTDDETGFGLALGALAFDSHDGYGLSEVWLGKSVKRSVGMS